ncbi:hypothetical protein HOM98_00060 [Candidatus Peregrinibacteria bacterium]|jgi:bile acid:Na+ symporter, BASS family|nr:hypothetical protein [Candidatus Peregrinibacteria bacterium]MBT7483981.1 hypothetical protein [Candidatus Peregrinibacteria bacterium]
MKILKILQKYASSAIIIAMVIGLLLPQASLITNNYVLHALVGIMLITFLNINPEAITKEFKNPLFLIYILVAYVIVIPVALFFVMKFLTPELCLGFLLYASLPPAVASPALTNIVKGNSALSLTIMVLINMIIPFSMIGLFSLLTNANIELDILGMFRTLILVVFVPLLVAQILRTYTPKIVTKLKPSLGGLSVLCILFVGYTVIGYQSKQILENPIILLKYLAYLYVIFFVLYLVGYFIAPWRPKKDRIGLAVTKTYPNAGLGIVLAFKFFTPEIALLLVISEIPWGTTIGFFKWLNKHLS